MEETLVFVYGDAQAAERASIPVTSKGHTVKVVSPESGDCIEVIADARPTAVVLDISDDWMAPLVVAQGVLADDRMSRPLLVFVGGSAEAVSNCKQTLPFGVYVKPEELVWVLNRLGLQL